MKLIETIPGSQIVKVYWCKEWSEYQVKAYRPVPLGKPMLTGTYHTADKHDAQETARKLAHLG